MTKQWFELFLRLFTSRDRATEMTGDLLEQYTGGLRFWWAAARLILALAWRPLLGVVGATIVFCLAVTPLGMLWQHASASTSQTVSQQLIFDLISCSLFGWSVAYMALVRYGVLSATTAVAFVLSALLTLASFLYNSPTLRTSAMGAFMGVVLVLLLTPAHRGRIYTLLRSSFAVATVSAMWLHAYGTLLRWMPAGLGAPLAVSVLMLAFASGWVLMGTPRPRGSHATERAEI